MFLLDEYGMSNAWLIIMDRRQDSMPLRLQQETVDLWLRIVTVLEFQEEAPKDGVETEKNRDKSSDGDRHVKCVDVRCFL